MLFTVLVTMDLRPSRWVPPSPVLLSRGRPEQGNNAVRGVAWCEDKTRQGKGREAKAEPSETIVMLLPWLQLGIVTCFCFDPAPVLDNREIPTYVRSVVRLTLF